MRSKVGQFVLVCCASVGFSAQAQQKADIARGEQLYRDRGACLSCHGEAGKSNIVATPSLAGQHPQYTIKQLNDYRSGKRKSAVMEVYAKNLSPQDVVDLAAYLAKQPRPLDSARKSAAARLGEKIYRYGNPERGIPACASCHGATGMGLPPRYPALKGQSAAYTQNRFAAFRSGARELAPAMYDIALRLRDEEVEALAEYTAGMR
jgi:cytochrome c553